MIKLTPFQWSAFNFFGFFCAYGVFLPFLPVWLKQYGYSTEIIGLLASFGYLFRFAGGMLASQQVKSPNQLIPTARILTLLNLIVIVVIAWSAESIWLLFPALMLFHIFNAGAMPIGDSIASLWQQQVGIDYGKARLFALNCVCSRFIKHRLFNRLAGRKFNYLDYVRFLYLTRLRAITYT